MITDAKKFSVTLISVLLLVACGGGSNDAAVELVSPSPEEAKVTILQPLPLGSGASIALSLNGSEITNIHWQQIDGPRVPIFDERQSLLGVELDTTPASYRFQVSYHLDGELTEQQLELSSEISEEQLLIRRDRNVAAGSEFSLRAALMSGQTVTEVSWQQTSGPTALTESAEELLFVTAPIVSEPSLLSFVANGTAPTGATYTDEVWVQVLPSAVPSGNAYFDEPLAHTFPYLDGRYSDALSTCVYNNSLTQSCLLARLPLLAAEAQANGLAYPTTDQIMQRVVVSHEWMGKAFEDFLSAQPHTDFHHLLSAVTAIVISYDIRPSFYWAATGAIYLDPENLWRTAQERDLINEQPDYRSGFGGSLQFDMLWRYTKNDEYAYTRVPRDNRATRELSDITNRFSALLYHELAHANDFFPPATHGQLAPQDSVLSAVYQLDWLSEQLTERSPLQSNAMTELAQVAFRGIDPTPEQEELLPEDVALMFPPDGAVDFYNYSSEREDLAMLFEELMMQYRLSVQRDVAITNNPSDEEASSSDYIVNWGQRGRIAEPWITERATWVLENILSELDPHSVVESLITPIPMNMGDSWADNLLLGPQENKNLRTNRDKKEQGIERLRYHGKPLPLAE
ncbi:hypothetical protein EZV61_05990 [Corallincola luteus]|uniref:Lipoprotein n=1 Tax=Corallincola luteus TaxID=1775177 RepID=A0ABY2AQP0_9GAMM|nr:hypothetical protein [Corallincola luteus]TCI05485.1 hypothetical protein EZV61_05990 [Corallincola luteus]